MCKEERQEGRREKREEGKKGGRRGRKKEGKIERRQKKECKCVFRHFQFHVVDYPPPSRSTNLDQGPGKNDTFFIYRKEERQEGRREKREEGKKGGRRDGRRKERKKGGKKRNVNVFLGTSNFM